MRYGTTGVEQTPLAIPAPFLHPVAGNLPTLQRPTPTAMTLPNFAITATSTHQLQQDAVLHNGSKSVAARFGG